MFKTVIDFFLIFCVPVTLDIYYNENNIETLNEFKTLRW